MSKPDLPVPGRPKPEPFHFVAPTGGYLGSFTGPPLIGPVAGTTSRPTAPWPLVAVGLAVAAQARPALHRRAGGNAE